MKYLEHISIIYLLFSQLLDGKKYCMYKEGRMTQI